VTLFGGLVLVALAGLMGRINIGGELRPMFHSLLGGLIGVIGVLLLLIALISFALAWGFWTGQGWAWAVGLGVAVIGIILGFLTLPGGLFRMLIDGLAIYYLTRPYVKRFFNH